MTSACRARHARGIALDKAGNLYIAGYSSNTVHKVDAVTGIMTLVAGSLAYTGTKPPCTTPYKCFSGVKGYSGDGGQAASAALNSPRGVGVDNKGNIWIADTGNNVMRTVNVKTGVITTVVGTTAGSSGGFGGDGGQANSSATLLLTPTDVVFDSSNNAYIVDFGNHRVREVSASTNVINTIIGNAGTLPAPSPVAPFPFPGTPTIAATTATVGSITKVGIDKYSNLYLSDQSTGAIYFYDAASQNLRVLAGIYSYSTTNNFTPTICAGATNSIGDGCPATQAYFAGGGSALSVAIDGQNNVYVGDPVNGRIRKVSTNLSFPSNAVGTPATQTVQLHFSINDAPTANGIAVASGFGDFSVSSAPTCTLNNDATTDCTFLLSFNPMLPGYRLAPLQAIGTLSAHSFAATGKGNAALASFDPGTTALLGGGSKGAKSITTDAAGNVYVADTANNRVLLVSASTLAVTTLAGTGTAGYSGDNGPATAATLSAPQSVGVDGAGYVYIADTGNNVIRRVDQNTGKIITFAGGASSVCAASRDAFGDGCSATQAALKSPAGLVADSWSNIYIADTGNSLLRRVDAATGYINLVAGGASAVCGAATDGYGNGCPPAQALLNEPTGLAIDSSGEIFISDTANNLIREIGISGLITQVAGNGQATFTGDGGPAISAALNAPAGISVDAAGDLYIADAGNSVIRFVAAGTQTISSLIGQGGAPGNGGGTGQASQVQLQNAAGVAVNSLGNVFVADTGNNRLLAINRNAGMLAFGSANVGDTTPSQTVTIANLGNLSLNFTQSPVYVGSGATSSFVLDTSAGTGCAGSSTLAMSASCTLAATFAPAAQGSLVDTLTLPSNAVNAGLASIGLTGTGVQLATVKVNLALTSPATGQLEYGQTGTVTAMIAPTISGTGTPTGSVIFSVDGKQQPGSVNLASGQASLNINLPVGTHTVGAIYSGDANFAASSGTTTIPVMAALTTNTLTVSPASIIQLQTLTFTSTVASTSIGIPTGTVSFYSGTTLLGTATLNAQGVATYKNLGTLAVGTYSINSVYSGDPNYTTSTSNKVAAVVNPIPPDFALLAQPSSLSIPSGSTGQTQITITPQGHITGAVGLSCSGLPASAICTFLQTDSTGVVTNTATNSVTLDGTNSTVVVNLTVWTNTTSLAQTARLENTLPAQTSAILPAMILMFPAALLGAGAVFARRRGYRGGKMLMMIAFAVFVGSAIMTLNGCGGGTHQFPANGVTPAGTSTIIVTFAGPDNVTHVIPVTVNVIANSTSQNNTPADYLDRKPIADHQQTAMLSPAAALTGNGRKTTL